MASEAQQARFLALLKEMNGAAGNGALREALGWQEATYDRVKEALIAAGRIERGRGRGGSVHLVARPPRAVAAAPKPAAAPRAAAMAQAAAPARQAAAPPNAGRPVHSYRHPEDTRKNIPTAELETVMRPEDKTPVQLAYERRNRDLDPQLVWRGKDEQDWSDLIVQAPPLYIQEKVHPQALVEDLKRRSRAARPAPEMPDLFADFNGLEGRAAATEFYQHDQHWSNRMILGDSLAVMASLAEREGLRGQVQCIYLDPPYGIKFNSNFQWSTTSRDVKDGDRGHVTREPEQVRAFRETWRDGIHSYPTYLRDRLTVARDLLHESGSIFVQIGDENVHRVRAVMDEVFGENNFCSAITVVKTAGASSDLLAGVSDHILWFARSRQAVKYRELYAAKRIGGAGTGQYTRVLEADGRRRGLTKAEQGNSDKLSKDARVFRLDNMTSQRPPGDFPVMICGRELRPSKGYWKTGEAGMPRLLRADRMEVVGNTLTYRRYIDDFSVFSLNNVWTDTGASGFGDEKVYVVQTIGKIVERCILMTTDPGDLVLDPTCGSGTTAYVAEQWGAAGSPSTPHASRSTSTV